MEPLTLLKILFIVIALLLWFILGKTARTSENFAKNYFTTQFWFTRLAAVVLIALTVYYS
jgi:hypothetical protein